MSMSAVCAGSGATPAEQRCRGPHQARGCARDGSGSGGSEAGGDEEGFESDCSARSGGAVGSSEALDSGSSSHESDSSPGRHVHDSDTDDEHAHRRVCRFFNRAGGAPMRVARTRMRAVNAGATATSGAASGAGASGSTRVAGTSGPPCWDHAAAGGAAPPRRHGGPSAGLGLQAMTPAGEAGTRGG